MSDGSRSEHQHHRSGLRRTGWPLALAATVFFASGESDVAAPGFIPSLDKFAHFAVFGLMATLVLRVVHRESRPWLSMLLALAITSLYGAADEFRQSFTPGRSVEVADWIMDTAGAAVAVLAYGLWPAWRRTLERGLGQPRREAPETAGDAPVGVPGT